jgi:hypothetical protein
VRMSHCSFARAPYLMFRARRGTGTVRCTAHRWFEGAGPNEVSLLTDRTFLVKAVKLLKAEAYLRGRAETVYGIRCLVSFVLWGFWMVREVCGWGWTTLYG